MKLKTKVLYPVRIRSKISYNASGGRGFAQTVRVPS